MDPDQTAPMDLHCLLKRLLGIIYVISVLFCYAFMHVCLLMPGGHLLGKG